LGYLVGEEALSGSLFLKIIPEVRDAISFLKSMFFNYSGMQLQRHIVCRLWDDGCSGKW
jgi:hypothetical protein